MSAEAVHPMPEHCTPGPWDWESVATAAGSGGFHIYVIDPAGRKIGALWGKADEKLANAHLIAAALDHAAIGWAMCVAAGSWDPFGDGRGEFCLNGIRHSTRLDPFGVPVVTPHLRACIARARGSASAAPAEESVS